jgi:hypothetical protein
MDSTNKIKLTSLYFHVSFNKALNSIMVEQGLKEGRLGIGVGKYIASHTSWYHSYQSNLSPTVADTGTSFRPENFRQHFPNESPYSNAPTAQQLDKLQELRVLRGKFNSPQDAHRILEWASILLRQGDESFLNNKLQQLRTLDIQGWRPI